MLQHFPGKQIRITLFLAYFATQIVAAKEVSEEAVIFQKVRKKVLEEKFPISKATGYMPVT